MTLILGNQVLAQNRTDELPDGLADLRGPGGSLVAVDPHEGGEPATQVVIAPGTQPHLQSPTLAPTILITQYGSLGFGSSGSTAN